MKTDESNGETSEQAIDDTSQESDLGTVSLLLRRAKRGCHDSRERLLRRFRGYLIQLAREKRGKQLEAKIGVSDIVQQSLLQANRGLDDFRGERESQWKAWLKMLLINEVRQSARYFSRERRDIFRERSLTSSREESPFEAALDSGQESPEERAIRQEQLDQLATALGRLSKDYRTVIELRSLQRMPMAKVAERMQRSVDATAKLWYRAIHRLKSEMNHE
ncbi:MAG: sigma-70 family RNA polymerase sigma factor [Planctomycetota bacterium]